MTKMKKLVSLVLAALMLVGMMSVASAVTITIDKTGGQYAVYRVLDVEVNTDGTYVYSVNPTYKAALVNALNSLMDSSESEIDSTTVQDNALIQLIAEQEDARAFADALYAAVIADSTIQPDETVTANNDGAVYTGDSGYYLIAEVQTAGSEDPYSLVMLDTQNEEEVIISTKDIAPTISKKILHDDKGEWVDVGDNQIGDTVNFKIESSLPDDRYDYMDQFEDYIYVIHDNMDEGLTFDSSSVVVKAKNADGELVELDAGNDYELIVGSYSRTYTDLETGDEVVDTCNDCDFHIKVTNPAVLEDNYDTIVVEFSAVLNENALIFDGENANETYLEYSNNPYDETETTESVKDEVWDWTFEIDFSKENPLGEELTGAYFVLSQNPEYTGTYDENGVLSETEGLIAVVHGDADESGKVKYTVDDNQDQNSNENANYLIQAGKVRILGLADEKYYLHEVAAPASYNKLTQPVEINITTEWVNGETMDTATDPVVSYSFTINGENIHQGADSNSFVVVNNSGVELPSTGGIGTTIFYAVGGLLVVLAVVLLVTKRRVGEEN